jgi:hypothetical protein
VRARILRIDDAEMKVGLSGLNVESAAPAAEPAKAAPEAAPAPTEAPAADAEAAPKKKRTRKKAEDAPAKAE